MNMINLYECAANMVLSLNSVTTLLALVTASG